MFLYKSYCFANSADAIKAFLSDWNPNPIIGNTNGKTYLVVMANGSATTVDSQTFTLSGSIRNLSDNLTVSPFTFTKSFPSCDETWSLPSDNPFNLSLDNANAISLSIITALSVALIFRLIIKATKSVDESKFED